MNRRLIYILGVLALIFFITSLIIFLNSNSGTKKKPQSQTTEISDNNSEAPEKRGVKIFFLTESSRFFRPVRFVITVPENREEIYREFLDLMFSETSKRIIPYPESLKLNSIYYVKDEKMLVLDFQEDLLTDFPGGSRGEIEFIYFFVNNICYNFKEIEKVKFLIGGNEYKTLSGHLNIQNPFYPNYGLIRDER